MNLQDACRKIYEYASSLCESEDAPIAYVNIEVGIGFPFSDEDLWNAYHKVVWDTDLSASDLNIEKTASLRNNEISLVSLSEFSDGQNPEKIIVVPLNAYRFSV